MSPSGKTIESDFKKLTPEEQAELYDRLGQVVYGESEEDEAFIETLRRRVREIEMGTVKGRDAFEVIEEMKAKYAV